MEQLTAIAAWLNTAFAGLDASVAVFIHTLFPVSPFMTFIMEAISITAKAGIPLILLSIAFMFPTKSRRVALTCLLAVALGALITNVIFKPMVLRPRPYTFEGSVFQQYWMMVGQPTESDFSFPSGHTTAAAAASMGVFLGLVSTRKNTWWATVLCILYFVLMGISRIYLSVHYFTDVIGGVVAGFAGGGLGELVVHFIPQSFYDKVWIKKKRAEAK